jgi:hypothetical protein
MGWLKNGLRFLLCLSAFLLVSPEINAQQKSRTITIIIDTVEIKPRPNESNPGFNVYFTLHNSISLRDTISYIKDYTKFSLFNFPDYAVKANIYDDSAVLNIPLDLYNGNTLQINNIYYAVKDTLRINKITGRKDCHNDTAYSTKYYYHKIKDGSLGEPYKVKEKTYVFKRKCSYKYKLDPSYFINGQQYFGKFSTTLGSTTSIIWAHGYRPKRYLKDREDFKGKLTKIATNVHEYNYFDIIIINLE